MDQAIDRLLQLQAMQDALARYCRGVDRGDAALVQSAYHADAIDEHASVLLSGNRIGADIIAMTRNQRVTHHSINNTIIEFLSSDLAASESYYSAWQTVPLDGRERVLVAVGRYLDRFERRQGTWKIAHRHVIVDISTLLAETDPPLPHPRHGRRTSDDPSFALFHNER